MTTRHNVGAWYVKQLANENRQYLKENRNVFGYTGHFNLGEKYVRLLVPTKFMNDNGKAVAAMATFYHIAPEEILIAHDELNISPGYARLKYKGSHGGHNGLKDIIHSLGNNPNFYRLRIGIGHPGDKNKVVSFVLDTPSVTEQELIQNAINESVRCTSILIQEDAVKAMHQLHTHLSIS
ncbi:Peptidyl-tRNA hydrolase [Candidatus Palibaumannia cicadellinicola]|uniref:Peptidyl-tRNA hydrolase n=2 Tax=Candidatus Palibaumannia cicadellinicola TaxID=186490 RepID=A0A088N1J9_9GAMM|nr:Peptidyl-tRNA hydrolase [Candidatus Baumannia cicadellinicola]